MNKWTFGKFEPDIEKDSIESENEKIYDKNTDTEYRSVMFLTIINPLNEIILYKRKALSLLDYLSNVAALCTTIYNILCKAFEILYSQHFDNYKIIQKILTKESKNEKKYNNKTESNFNLEMNLINKDSDENKNNILLKDEDESNNEKIPNNEDENDKILNKLPKLRFYDYFFNNVYFKKCCDIKKQNLIDSCSNILYKYFSIENILYNQILFENVMKDYNWNNPKLKSIQNNNLILEVKKYV